MPREQWIHKKEPATYTKILRGKRSASVISWDDFGPDMCTILFDDDTALQIPYNHYTPFEDATGNLPTVEQKEKGK